MMWRSAYWTPRRSANSWWNQVRRMNRQMDFMFGGTRGPINRESPLLNAWAGDDGLPSLRVLPEAATLNLCVETTATSRYGHGNVGLR